MNIDIDKLILYAYYIYVFADRDNMPKNQFIVYYPEVNEYKIMQYEDPIIGFRNDWTPIRSSEL